MLTPAMNALPDADPWFMGNLPQNLGYVTSAAPRSARDGDEQDLAIFMLAPTLSTGTDLAKVVDGFKDFEMPNFFIGCIEANRSAIEGLDASINIHVATCAVLNG
jgi:hypothetical protein